MPLDDLALTLGLADAADAISMAGWRRKALRVDTKPDRSPVSEADHAVETELRRRLSAERPDDGILGEELGDIPGSSGRRWIIDPIDGTRAYVRGLPIFATLIALEQEGRTEVGVVSAPALGQRWWAMRGHGAYRFDGPIGVSTVASIAEAFLSTTDARHLTGNVRRGWDALAAQSWTARMLGDFWSHVLVADGSIDVAIEEGAQIWDWAALQVIVEEAGGRFSDLDGISRLDGPCAISTNGVLHADVLAALTAG